MRQKQAASGASGCDRTDPGLSSNAGCASCCPTPPYPGDDMPALPRPAVLELIGNTPLVRVSGFDKVRQRSAGHRFSFVDLGDFSAFEASLQDDTRRVCVETQPPAEPHRPYPGLASHPQRELARKQMRGFGAGPGKNLTAETDHMWELAPTGVCVRLR